MTVKKLLTVTMVMVMVLGFVGIVGASTIYDNWQGTMTGRDITRDGHYYGDAEGEVVLNYRKGQGDYMLKVEAWGLNPNVTYEIRGNYLEGTATVREPFAYVQPDADGYFHINLRGISPAFMAYEDYEMDARILVVRPDGWRVLTTAAGGGGTFEDAGSERGE